MNKVRKLAQELVEKYPSLFTSDFNANKQALSQVAVIKSRALRNQLAGAIAVLMRAGTPQVASDQEEAELETIAEITGSEGKGSDKQEVTSSEDTL